MCARARVVCSVCVCAETTLLLFSSMNLPLLLRRGFLSSKVPLTRSVATFSSDERVRRSLFNVPGSEEKKLNKSVTVQADCVVFDLEDGVAANRKDLARKMVIDALDRLVLQEGAEKAVRINHVGSGLEVHDLTTILRSSNLQAIVIPKVEHPHHVAFVGAMIDALVPAERRGSVRLLAAIESAKGLMNIREISTADPRLDALIVCSLSGSCPLSLPPSPTVVALSAFLLLPVRSLRLKTLLRTLE